MQVAKSELRVRSLVQTVSDLISILDERGYHLYLSPAVNKMLGYDPEFLIGKNAFAYMHADDVISAKAYLIKMGNNASSAMPAYLIKNIDGEWRWLDSMVTNLRDIADVTGHVFTSSAVTDNTIAVDESGKLYYLAR